MNEEVRQFMPFDNPEGLSADLPMLKDGITIGSSTRPVGIIYLTDLIVAAFATGTAIADVYKLTDGSDKNYTIQAVAAGTAYSLTNTSAALDFGTTDPVLTINKAGTYLLRGKVNLKYNGATFAAGRTVTLKLRRTNNTAGDISGGSEVVVTAIVTTVTATFLVVTLPDVIYTTTNINDAITIYGDVSVVPTAGSLDAVSASITAVRLH